jgi:hypothetical protein
LSDNSWKNLLEAADRFGRQWADLNRRLDDWNERTKPALEHFIEDARKVGDGLSIFPVAFATTLVRGGWSEAPLNGGMPLAEAAELTERLQGKSDDQVRQELDVAIPAYFRKDDYAPLSEMVASWRLHFTDHRESVAEDTLWAHHRQVFEEALWAHKKKRYTLSISALAPQFEGVGQDLMKEYGKKPSGWQDSLNKVLDYEPNQPSKPHEIMPGFMALPIVDRFNKVEETVEELNKHVTPLRIDEFFEKGNPSRAKAVWSVNRHSIAHGNFRNFVEAESLKVFFILDLLHRAVGIYRDREDPPPERKSTESP